MFGRYNVPALARVIMALVLFANVFYVPSVAFAQPTVFETTEDYEASLPTPITAPAPTGGGAGGGAAPTGSTPGGAAATETVSPPTTQPAITITPTEGSCFSSVLGFLNCFVVGFLGSFVAIAGYAFDQAILLFIVEFGRMYTDGGIGYVAEETWTVVRDVFNIFFIFGLIYIGFQIILGVNESGAKRTIPLLIIAALLINFSLFIVKMIVDFANVAAYQIYRLFIITKPTVTPSGEADVGDIVDLFNNLNEGGIALAFLNSIGVLNLLAFPVQSSGASLLYVFGVSLLFLVLIYVFLIGAALITIRFVVLIFYIIFSPAMFLGWIFPGFQSVTKKFWEGLLNQAFFAPAFLFMLYVSYRLMAGFSPVDGSGNNIRKGVQAAAGTRSGGEGTYVTGFGEMFLFFILAVVFLLASVMIARKMANTGSSTVMKINDAVTGRIKGGLIGAGIGATHLPRAGARMGLNAAGERLERGLNNIQSRDGTLSKMARWNWVDRSARGAVTSAAAARLGTTASNKENREYKEKTQSRASQTRASNDRDAEVVKAEKALKDTATSADDLNDALEKLTKNIGKMTTDELAYLGVNKLKQTHYATGLSDAQLTDLEKSGKMSAAEVAQIKEARGQGFVNIARSGTAFAAGAEPAAYRAGNATYRKTVNDAQRKSIRGRSVADIGKMPAAFFAQEDMATHITPLMLAERMKNGLSGSDADKIHDNLQMFLDRMLSDKPTSQQRNMWKKWTDESDRGAEFGLIVI